MVFNNCPEYIIMVWNMVAKAQLLYLAGSQREAKETEFLSVLPEHFCSHCPFVVKKSAERILLQQTSKKATILSAV